jgi:hypothetical protein
VKKAVQRGKAEWIDMTEAVGICVKVVFIVFVAASLLCLWLSYGFSEAINLRMEWEEARNIQLRTERQAIEKRIDYLKGKIDTLDPVFDWWFSLMHGRMAEKRQQAFKNIYYILRYVAI